ncbi:MAG: hypothetical protein WAX69_21370 [Victivallales bacterium]
MSRRYNWAVILGDMQANLFMSQETLAETFKLSQQSISAYMHGARYPSHKIEQTLLHFALKHNIPVDYEHTAYEQMKMQKLLLTDEGFARLLTLYDRMSVPNRKKLIRYAVKMCG